MPRILIVEDEVHLAQGLLFNLEAEGLEAVAVESGELALERLLKNLESFDAIVLDAVSYTHLDVYKRQAGGRCLRRW